MNSYQQDNRYKLFIDSVLELAKTIVIKSAAAASAINQELVDTYGALAVSEDPTTWKYYMNLAGEYHPSNTIMTVVSMDTEETIVFSKENLLIHRATARGYVFGSRPYTELLSSYPDQEKLILGILYPVDQAAAIAADDGAILGYPPHLVETNEYNFITKLQAWIDNFQARWVVRGFAVTDQLYTATWMMLMYIYLVPAILEIRLAACKTNEAHSFHVKKYLASHGLNENYLDYLTLAQSLWLYRNIEYLQHNLGKQENFDLLMANLMTARSLPLAEYTMRHDVTAMPDSIYPEVVFRRKTLNIANQDLVPTILTLQQILDKQDKFARSNKTVKTEALPVIKELMENSPSNVLMTKYLESTVVDYGDASPYTMIDVLMGHWPYLAAKGLYKAFVQVTNPRTGEIFTVSVKDAFVLACYAFARANGFTPDFVPAPLAERVQRIPTPNTTDLLSVVDKGMVSVAEAQQALSQQPPLTTVISTEAFYDTCLAIYHAEQLQRGMMAAEEHPVKRAMVQNMVARIYSDARCSFPESGTYYSTWLAQRNIDLSSFADTDFQSMYLAIIQTATGLDLHSKVSIKDIQHAMVGLFSDLSSYSIQINAIVNSNDLVVMDTPAVRIGIESVVTHDHEEVQDIAATIQDVSYTTGTSIPYEINPPGSHTILTVREHLGAIKYETGINMVVEDMGRSTRMVFNVPVASFKFADELPGNDRGIIPVPGIPEWLALTPEEQLQVTDMYDSGLPPVIPLADYSDPNDIDNVLRQKILDGLTYNPDQP